MEATQIPLLSRHGEVVDFALVDAEDAVWLQEHQWHLFRAQSELRYAIRHTGSARSGNQQRLFMHRVIMDVLGVRGIEVDHRNRNGLDNRRSNLRLATHAQNHQNKIGNPNASSVYRGVYWYPGRGRWRAGARLNGHYHHIGFFVKESDAAQAAAEWRAKHMPYAIV